MKNNLYDIIFILNSKELVRYDFENSFKGEAQATRELLAYENNVKNEDIKIYYQKRVFFSITLYRGNSFKSYGEYENLDYNNTLAILSDCIDNGNSATITARGQNFYEVLNVCNNERLRYFVEEFQAVEL